MEFSQWEPIYHEILRDFGYSLKEDERSAGILASLFQNKADLSVLNLGGEVTVCGCGPNLENDLNAYGLKGKVIAADGAVSRLDVLPDVIVTDLDGCIEKELECSRRGSVVVLHAHGDNIETVKKYALLFEGPVIPTVQCRPVGSTYNFGGFSDGDRAVLLAHSIGVRKIHLRGFDFKNPYPKIGKDSEVKKKKLIWAEKIISMFDSCLLIP